MDGMTLMRTKEVVEAKFAGFVEVGQPDNFDKFFIVDFSGYKFDLLNRVEELVLNFGKTVSVTLHTANTPTSEDDIITNVLGKMDGDVSIDYDAYQCGYSEYTNWMEYETGFWVGGHDFTKILTSFVGKYMILTMSFKL